MKAIIVITLAAVTAYAGMAYSAEPQPPPPKSLGFYVGAGLGTATANTTVIVPGWQTKVDSSTTGWNLFAGFRPQQYFGAELAYIDFGSAKVNNVSDGNQDIFYQARAKNSAIAGYIVGYLPLLPARWDIFAKAGYASLKTTTDSNGNFPNIATCIGSSCGIIGAFSTSDSKTSGEFTYGLGTQYRFDSLAVRLEYQRIDGTNAKPEMFSLGLAWNF